MNYRTLRIVGWNLLFLFFLVVLLEFFLRIYYFGPQELITADADSSWLLQLPDRFIPEHERRERLSYTEINRLPYTARLDKLYRISGYQLYGDLEPNRDVLFLAKPDHPYRLVTNSSGLRRKEQTTAKSSNVVRVLCLGDSFTYGPHLSNGDTFPDIVEEILNSTGDKRKFEVLNAGVVGYFLRREKELYVTRAREADPDIVVLQVLDNDLSGYIKSGYIESDFPTPDSEKYPRPPSENLVRSKSETLKYKSVSFVKTHSDKIALFYLATNLIDWLYFNNIDNGGPSQDSGRSGYYAAPTQERDAVALEIWSDPAQSDLLHAAKLENERDFRELVEAVASDGAVLLVLYIPTQKTLRMHDEDVEPVDAYYRELAEKYGVNYLSLLDTFAADEKRHTLFLWPWNLHLSSIGNYMVANELKNQIVELSKR